MSTSPSLIAQLLAEQIDPVPDVECMACYAANNPAPDNYLRIACLIGIATGMRFGKDVPLCEDCLGTLKAMRKGLSEGLGES